MTSRINSGFTFISRRVKHSLCLVIKHKGRAIIVTIRDLYGDEIIYTCVKDYKTLIPVCSPYLVYSIYRYINVTIKYSMIDYKLLAAAVMIFLNNNH